MTKPTDMSELLISRFLQPPAARCRGGGERRDIKLAILYRHRRAAVDSQTRADIDYRAGFLRVQRTPPYEPRVSELFPIRRSAFYFPS